MTGVEALERALDDARSDIDPIPATELALAILRAEAGEEPMPELDDELPCTCPPGLAERGGFRSGCPAHAPHVHPGAPAFRPDELLRTTPDSADTTGPLVDFEPLTDTAAPQERRD